MSLACCPPGVICAAWRPRNSLALAAPPAAKNGPASSATLAAWKPSSSGSPGTCTPACCAIRNRSGPRVPRVMADSRAPATNSSGASRAPARTDSSVARATMRMLRCIEGSTKYFRTWSVAAFIDTEPGTKRLRKNRLEIYSVPNSVPPVKAMAVAISVLVSGVPPCLTTASLAAWRNSRVWVAWAMPKTAGAAMADRAPTPMPVAAGTPPAVRASAAVPKTPNDWVAVSAAASISEPDDCIW